MVRTCVLGLILAVVTIGNAKDVRSAGADLFVNEIRIHTFRTQIGSISATNQASRAAEVLRAYNGQSFSKLKKGTNWVVKMGDRAVLIITPAEAKTRNVMPQTLAATICQRIVDALQLPELAVDKTTLKLPPDRPGQLKLSGSGATTCKLTVSDKSVVRIERSNSLINVIPVNPGNATIQFVYGSTNLSVSVAIRPYAFDTKQTFEAEVAGNPADAGVVAGAICAAIQAKSTTPAMTRVFAKVLDSAPLYAGQFRAYKVRVQATSEELIPVDTTITVKTTNLGVSTSKDDELWYSNNPENIQSLSRLYWAKLDTGKSARMLYHHINGYSMPIVVRYMIANPSDQPAKVSISLGEGKPDKNPTRAGYIAGDLYLKKWLSRSAEVVTIPPRSTLPVSIRKLTPGQTCSGLASIYLLPGGPSDVVVIGDAHLPITLYPEWNDALNVIGAWHIARPKSLNDMRLDLIGFSTEVFPEPFLEARMDYEAGGRFGYARIGEEPLMDAAKQKSLAGNFGVVYQIEGTLRNPTPSPVEVELLFEASAGYGSGLFVVNGDYVKLGLINPKQEIVLTSIKLPPGSSKPLKIQTIPLSGANYPVTLIVRPTGFELKSNLAR